MKSNRYALGVFTMLLLLVALCAFGQTNLVPVDTAPVNGGSISINLAEFGSVAGVLLVLGAVLKNAFPNFPNRFIPLLTWIVGVLAYLALSGAWSDPKQWIAAILASATATGIHSGVKNTFSAAEVKPEPPKP